MGRGALIVLEGCDRAGKSTQVKMLANALQLLGIPTETRQFPNRSTDIGGVINEYLTHKKEYPPETIHLLFAANRWEYSKEIERILKAGTTIIVDRYAASGAAYAAANTGKDISWCKNPDKGLPAPDLVAYLKIDEESQKSRCGWANERYEKVEFQKKVAENFSKLVEATWKIIETGDVEQTHSMILEAATHIVKSVGNCPLNKLYEPC
ncbi:thymidylate kinase [Venturia canescens]|uniref:thymidylate kinase n=1 Tax=Venturia canescens TaxID=32260 RepID=UPI001C9D62FD|nr:thymidylate kinase [Venturia canescens]XP_043277082.1 thymidylate kinase [Venturia canescens]XP_043277083.1 thymidylate kinase [Venturia canescens]